MKQVISVMYNIFEQGGGVTRVSLARTQALDGTDTISRIALLAYDEKLGKTFENLVSQGRISSKTKIVNLHRWFAERATITDEIKDRKSQTTAEHLKVPVKRRTDYINGIGAKIVRYFTDKDYVFMEEFYHPDGTLAMVELLTPGKPVLKFNTFETIHAYWLKLLANECLPAFLIADAIQGADTVSLVESQSIYRILMMHSNHLMRPHTVGSAVAPKYDGVIRGIPYCESLVLLTDAQLNDLKEQFPSNRYASIGNPVNVEPENETIIRDENLAVVVARLHSIKRIKNIIRAFAKVVLINPAATLEIWGGGEQKDELQNEITLLEMSNSIKMMGFATDVSKIFRRASVSLAMSATEGFGVSFAESIAYGTPLVTTNTNYGPREIVTQGEDGFIVNSELEFIEKTLLLLGDKELVKRMGEKGKINAKRFSNEAITNKWISLFEKLESQGTLSTVKKSPDNEKITNTAASTFGWIYLPATTDSATIDFYKSSKTALVVDVCGEKTFSGQTTDLRPNSYEVDEMIFDDSKGVYRFRLLKDGSVFKDTIANSAVKFVLL